MKWKEGKLFSTHMYHITFPLHRIKTKVHSDLYIIFFLGFPDIKYKLSLINLYSEMFVIILGTNTKICMLIEILVCTQKVFFPKGKLFRNIWIKYFL